MKTFTTLMLVIAAGSCAFIATDYEDLQRGQVGDMISDLINATLRNITGGLPEPIVLNDTQVVFTNNTELSGGFNTSNFKLLGLKHLYAPVLNYNLWTSSLNITLVIPDFQMNFKYGLDVLLADLLPLYGAGVNSIDIEEIKIDVKGQVSFVNGTHLNNMTVVLTVGRSTFGLNGLINNPEFTALVNTALNDNFSDFVDNNQAFISKIISPAIESLINSILAPINKASVEIFSDSLASTVEGLHQTFSFDIVQN